MALELKSLVLLLLLAVVWELSAQGATERQINPEVREEKNKGEDLKTDTCLFNFTPIVRICSSELTLTVGVKLNKPDKAT